MRLALLAPLAVALAASACADRGAPAPARATEAVPYRLDAPDGVAELPARLQEISGLTVLPTGRLGAVQDENGVLYEIDAASGRVTGEQPFGNDGDYEGVELTPEAVWVLRSDGDLYRVSQDRTGRVEAQKFETALRRRNDTEGLAYDPEANRLLIACKEDPGEGFEDVRTIYAFDLATETLAAAPVAVIDRRQVDGEASFKPSALAVDPRTGRMFVLSSVEKALAVLAPDGTLVSVTRLSPRLFPQPEGIAFDAAGTLYIANEGRTGAGTLLRFSPTDV
ncbi:MAG: SdiA-regulated domain-containing protein [Bacteroidota bacterium]